MASANSTCSRRSFFLLRDLSGAFEILHGALVLPGLRSRGERSEIPAPPGFRILLHRIQPVFPALQFANHTIHPCSASATRR